MAPERISPVVLYMVSDLSAPRSGLTIYAFGMLVKELRLTGAEGVCLSDVVDARTLVADCEKLFLPESMPNALAS